MFKTIHFFIATLAILGVSYTGSAGAISIDFVPNSSIMSVGSTVTMDVKISGLGNGV